MKKKLATDKHQNKEVMNQIEELYRENERFKVIEKQHKEIADKLNVAIKNFMFINGVNLLQFKPECFNDFPRALKCQQITPVTIKFDGAKVEKRIGKLLGKNRVSEFVTPKVTIENWNEFSKYMKELGADPKIIKKLIAVEKVVNKKAIDNASKLGLISKDDLDGTFTLVKSSSYLRIDEVEDEQSEE